MTLDGVVYRADASGRLTTELTPITGTAQATAAQMTAYLRTVNPNVAQSVLDMIPCYLSEGAAEGIRGDIAFAQSCLETGNFTFRGSAVTLEQNNFCGMGVTSNGVKGNSFATPQLGIRAQIQHLKAYASTAALRRPAWTTASGMCSGAVPPMWSGWGFRRIPTAGAGQAVPATGQRFCES